MLCRLPVRQLRPSNMDMETLTWSHTATMGATLGEGRMETRSHLGVLKSWQIHGKEHVLPHCTLRGDRVYTAYHTRLFSLPNEMCLGHATAWAESVLLPVDEINSLKQNRQTQECPYHPSRVWQANTLEGPRAADFQLLRWAGNGFRRPPKAFVYKHQEKRQSATPA
jgi:hypothetical protein